jgi:ABC-type transporter Mla maintaining outer membrane lipid asymmetry ATPase subunit MlaF
VLLKHMIGLMQPDRGEIWIDGTDIAHLKGKALNEVRKKFAMLFQSAALFDSMTVFENVAFPLREKLRLKGEVVTRRVEEKLGTGGIGGHGAQVPGRTERRHAQTRRVGARLGDGAGDHSVRRADDRTRSLAGESLFTI